MAKGAMGSLPCYLSRTERAQGEEETREERARTMGAEKIPEMWGESCPL